MVEVSPKASSESRGRRESAVSPSASVGNLPGDPYREGPSQQQGSPRHTVGRYTNNAPTSIADLRMSPREFTYGAPSDRDPCRQTTSEVPSHAIVPLSPVRKQSSSPQSHRPLFQQRTTSPQPPQSLPSPSLRAKQTLEHILHLRRQFSHEPSVLIKSEDLSPSPSPFSPRLHPVLKTPTSGNPPGPSSGSPADAVAIAINEGARLDRLGPSGSPVPSTPLRVYKKRLSSSTALVRRSEGSAVSHEEHRERRSQSSRKYSSPPIVVLPPTELSTGSRKASPSTYGDEYNELALSYPPSPTPSLPGALPDSRPPAIVSTESPRPRSVELVEQILQPSLQPSLPDEDAVMQSSALHYLKRYFRTFDRDRRALAEMYAPDATFSCSSRNLRAQGRDSILDALQVLGRGVLCSGNSVEYDVTYLGPRIGVLLVVLGTMRYARDNSEEVGYAMNFVLRPTRKDQERLE